MSITNATGTLCYDADFYPFGRERVVTNTCAQNYKFTGLERDTETSLDHTLNRQYSSNTGRRLSPDPRSGSVTNAQSLNRYAYVLNNPTNFVEPLGLACTMGYVSGSTACHWGGGAASVAYAPSTAPQPLERLKVKFFRSSAMLAIYAASGHGGMRSF